MSTPATPPQTITPRTHVSVHRWPWTTEEVVSMGLVFTFWVGIGLLTRNPLWITTLAFVGLASAYWLYRVKKHRVSVSQVTVSITGTRVAVASDGPLGASAVDVAKVTDVGYRRYMSDETFMLSDGTMTAKVPVRATADPVVRDAVRAAFANAATVSKAAEDLHDQMS